MVKIVVVVEVKAGEVRKPTLELLSHIRKSGFEADAVIAGENVKGLADRLAGHGAGTVYVADDSSLSLFSVPAYLGAIAEAVEKSQANQVWFSGSESSKVLAPALAARLDGAYCGDAIGVEMEGETLTVAHPAMATKVIQKVRFRNEGLKVLVIRSGTFDVEPAEPKPAHVVELAAPALDGRVVTKEVIQESAGEIDLGDASTIVSVGRGVKGPEGIEFVRPLVDALGAAYGATRAVVDSGWMPHNTQVGQTGRVVAPDVYFAIGVSGAIQHMAGMSGSKLIIAVNKDPDAPIFSIADYGIVGDLFKVVPLLIDEVKKVKS